MDVTVMSGVTDRYNVQVLMETSCFIAVFVQESGFYSTVPHIYVL